MPRYFRYGGQVVPHLPPTAPLALRLPSEVYALDGCVTGPEIHPPGSPHHHNVKCDTSFDAGHSHSLGAGGDYIVAPGARLEVGSHGKLYETMGAIPYGKKGIAIASIGAVAIAAFLLTRKKGNR